MSIIHDVAQGSAEWRALRLGIPTASQFDRIITAARGELSKQARKYAHTLVAETLLGEPLDCPIGNLEWVARGKLLEPHAVQQYEFSTDVETRAVGFITTDDGRMGCSPDRLVITRTACSSHVARRARCSHDGASGGLEIKCAAPATHMGLLIDGPGDDYRPQVQGQLLVAELDWIDLYAFHPSLPPMLVRTYRDEPYIAKMRVALDEFCDMKDAMLAQAYAGGFRLSLAA